MTHDQPPRHRLNIFLARPQSRSSPLRRSVDRLLSVLGPSWQYSPLRRVSQILCLAVFCGLFFYVAWPYASVFTENLLLDKELLPVELFLSLDPLVALTTSIASRTLNIALLGMAIVLVVCCLSPRAFCGYICPLGTLIDGFDWFIGRRIRRFKLNRRGPWVHLKYYLLTAVLTASLSGVVLSGYVAAIPVLTRGFVFTGGHIQLGLMKSWTQAGPLQAVAILSLGLFACVFLLSLFGRRFWCRCICLSGATFSVFNFLRLGRRNVDSRCIDCGRCIEVCPFDAIEPDYTTRSLDCTFCQTCGGVCPTGAVNFVFRSRPAGQPASPEPSVEPQPVSRRALIASGIAGVGAAAGMQTVVRGAPATAAHLIRPPGSVQEAEFLQLCVRCGECFKVCPGPVLHPAGLEFGLQALWTPVVVPSHAGCHQDCNFCTQVCPTRAIRPLTLSEKRRTCIGLAKIDPATCLSRSGRQDCQLCFDECKAAGYNAIEMRPVELELGDIPEGVFSDAELEAMSSIQAPFVNPDACTGCGLCEYRCHTAYTRQQQLLPQSAVKVVTSIPRSVNR